MGAVDGIMDYEDYGGKPKVSKKVTTKFTKRMAAKDFDSLATWTVLGLLVKRHKYGLALNALILENLYMLLHWFQMI